MINIEESARLEDGTFNGKAATERVLAYVYVIAVCMKSRRLLMNYRKQPLIVSGSDGQCGS